MASTSLGHLAACIHPHPPRLPHCSYPLPLAVKKQRALGYGACLPLDRLLHNRVSLKLNTSWAEKPAALLQTPYARTLFLDVDTTVCAPLRPLFMVLSQYDIAMAPEPLDTSDMLRLAKPGAADVPTRRYFEMNSGVVLYRNTQQMSRFFRKLASRQTSGDQHFFHLFGTANGMLGMTSQLRVLQLPREYNLRMRGGDAPRLLTQTVRVIHGKSANFPHISCASVNRYRGFRLWSSSSGTVPVNIPQPPENATWAHAVHAMERKRERGVGRHQTEHMST